MVDIHCHIMYGLDDGADCLDESVKMALMAFKGGTRHIIATPHSNVPDVYRNEWNDDMDMIIQDLNDNLLENGCDLKIYPGQEIYCEDRFIENLQAGKLITLNHSKYPLVEFNFFEHSFSVYEKIERLVSEGYCPVVAHPERYAFVQKDADAVFKIKQLGALIQLNKGSLGGKFGKQASDVSQFILRNTLADFVASDAHSPFSRTPYLENVYELVAENFSSDYADVLFYENPECVLKNKSVQTY